MDGNYVGSAVVEWGAEQKATTKAKRDVTPKQRLLMDVVEQALNECGFLFTPQAGGPSVLCARDSIVRDRYFIKIAEPDDGEDEERAYARKRKDWFRAIKATLDAKALKAAPYGSDRVLWKP